MKAIVCHKYGSPDDVLELQEVDSRWSRTIRAGTSSFGCRDAADWHHLLGTPYIVRTTAGLF